MKEVLVLGILCFSIFTLEQVENTFNEQTNTDKEVLQESNVKQNVNKSTNDVTGNFEYKTERKLLQNKDSTNKNTNMKKPRKLGLLSKLNKQHKADMKKKKKKKKKKKLKPLTPPNPPKRPRIPKLVTLRRQKRKRPKDIIDKLPNTLDKYKYRTIEGKKYMIIPKYKPMRTYMKYHDKEDKEYPNTDKYVSSDAQMQTILPRTYGIAKRKKDLIFKDMAQNGDNPTFNPSMHADLEYDYFQLTFPYLDTRLDRLKQIRDYIKKWMKIDPENEDVEIRYFKQGGETILNRVIVSYFNRKFYKKKRYIIDFKFAMEQIIKKPLLKIAKLVRDGGSSGKYYEKNYEFTLKYKCGVIRKKLLNPKIFRCTPVINEQHYILNNLFLVDTVLYRKMYKGLLFSYEAFIKKNAKPLYPNPINAMTEPLGDPREMILRRVKALKHKFRKTYKPIQKILNRPKFKKAIGNLVADIKEYKLYYNSQSMLGEKQYQKDLKSDLWELQKQMYSHLEHVFRNYEMMLRKVEESNSYNIEQEVFKMRSKLDTLQNFAVYLIKRRRFILEEHIRKILNFLDYIQYKKNRKFEAQMFAP